MAETREQINPKVTPMTKALLLTYCQEKRTTQSDVVEAALGAFLQPKEGDDLPMVMLQLLHGIAAKQARIANMSRIRDMNLRSPKNGNARSIRQRRNGLPGCRGIVRT